MEALVNSLDATAGGDPAALSREQLEAELTKLRSENDQLRTAPMDTDDPFQLLRDLPEDDPRPSPSKFNRGKASASGERIRSTARREPLGPPPTGRGTLDITKFFAPEEAARYRRCADKGAAEAAVRAARAAEKERAKPPDVIKEWAARHPGSGEIAQLGSEMVAAVSRGTTSLPLDQLVQMGFERGAAAATLVACGNDVTQAATLLGEAAEMARIKREESLRRDRTWRKRGQYEAKLAGLDHKGPQHLAALALTQPTIPLALLEAPSVDCVWDFIEQTNEEYDRLHEAYERQFWGERMALSSAEYSPENEAASKEALEAFLRDSDRLETCHRLREGLFTTDRQKRILDGFARVFDAYQMDPTTVALRSDCVPLERALTDQRKALTLSIDGAAKSAPQLRTILRTSADENVRERAWKELRRVGPCIADGLCALVKRRNAMARALGFDDFYDYKVSKTEGFGKKKLFEMLDALRDGTSALNDKARASLNESERQPWNISRATSGDETALDAYFPFGKALEAWGRSFARMGIRYRGSTMTLDLLERPNKYSNGFCHWPRCAYVRRDHSLRPSCTNFTSLCDPLQTGSGRIALKTLMHEAGHAAHFANVAQESPLFAQERAPTSIAYAETQAMFLDSLVSDASWRARYALNNKGERLPFALHENDLRSRHPYQVFQLRALLAVPYFEKALYEHSDLTPSTIIELADRVEHDIVGGLAARPLLSVPHILRDESSCYYHGYVMAEMAVQQTRRHFGSSIVDNPAVGEALTQAYWRPGNTANFMDLVEKLTHEPLSGNAWTQALNRDIDSLIESERRAYDDAIVTRDDVDLDMRIRIVDGDNVIADSDECGSFLATCRRFEAYLEKRYGDGMDRGHVTTERIVQREEVPVEEPRRKRSAAVAWGLDRPDKASVIITKIGYDMVESFHVEMTEGDALEQGGRIRGSTVSAVKPFQVYKRPKPTDRTEWTRWNNDQEQLIGRGEDTSPEEWRFKFQWRGCDFVVAGPSCLDRRRKKFQEDSEKKRLRSLPKRIRTLGDAATDAFLNGDVQRASDLRTVRSSLVEEHTSLREKHPSDKLLKKLKAINARIDMVSAPIGGAVKGGYGDQAKFCGRSLLPLFDERDKLELQLAERLGLKKKIPELRDRSGLEAKLATDGWTTEEVPREDDKRVDRFYLSPSGGKRLRSILEVARHAYPEYLVNPVQVEEGSVPLWHGRAGPVVPMAAPAVPQGGRVRKQPRLQTGPAPAQLRLATRTQGVAVGPQTALPAWREAGLLRTASGYNPLVRLPKSVLPKSLFPSVELPPSKWRPGMRVVVPARAFGEEWALENPGDYPGTIVELDEECAAGRTWLVDYEDGPTSTDEAFFAAAPAPVDEDEASEAPAAPPDPAYQDLPPCRDGGEALLRGALEDLMEF